MNKLITIFKKDLKKSITYSMINIYRRHNLISRKDVLSGC